MEPDSVREMEPDSVREMESNYVREMESNYVREMEPDSVREMEPDSVREMESNYVREMESNYVREMEPDSVREMEPDSGREMESNYVREMEPDSVREMESNYVREMESNYEREMEPDSVREMEPDYVREMEPDSVREMEPDSVREMESNYVREMEPDSVREMEPDSGGLPFHLLVLTGWLTLGSAMIAEIPLPDSLDNCFRSFARQTSVSQTVGQAIGYHCTQQYMWRQAGVNNWLRSNITREEYEWFSSLLYLSNRSKRYAKKAEIRVRKEIRALTESERNDYHRAVQLLKSDTSIYPNKYDSFANLHTGLTTTASHGGPNFLGWHRVYLLMFENALRQKVPTVTIPYWASSMDSKLRDPTQSGIWSERFFGNGNGLVRTGPYADWMTRSGPLIRNIGESGGYLFSDEGIQNILRETRTAAITEPQAAPNNNLEFLHGRIHDYIDGQMSMLATSSQDPVFFAHHAYVDFIWEVFRRKQKRLGIDPQMDYPDVVNHTLHTATAPLGFGNLRNIDSYSNLLIDGIYDYAPVPYCSLDHRDCGSPYLRCEVNNTQTSCVAETGDVIPRSSDPSGNQSSRVLANSNSKNRDNAQWTTHDRTTSNDGMPLGRMSTGQTNRVYTRQQVPGMVGGTTLESNMDFESRFFGGMDPSLLTPLQDGTSNVTSNQQGQATASDKMQGTAQCPAIPINQGYQNTYNLNGRADIRQWVYLPVKIISRRPPNFRTYRSFPVMDGRISEESDIYSPLGYAKLKERFVFGKLATNPTCHNGNTDSGKVFVQSNGINYLGTYKEYAIVDKRLAISIATAFVAVKSPSEGATDVILSAFDSCGRICMPFCRIPESNEGNTRPCSGAIRVTSAHPKLYGLDYGEAVLGTWSMTGGGGCPTLDNNHVFVSFYCDYVETWPFVGTEAPNSSAGGESALSLTPHVNTSPMLVILVRAAWLMISAVRVLMAPCACAGERAHLMLNAEMAYTSSKRVGMDRCFTSRPKDASQD
ncbi:uncharacterized protein LOC132544015 [Ylistrum balloti]|uniref:uncharacterized protein LOC132544015 n=1 Tax=Ylistrum balloti TaxID=509963 RepID=UPI002905C23D|nr:uncharacterized protein LOC132544015 [Ylistrum balloti]